MVSLEEQLVDVRKQEEQILSKIDKRNAKRKIKCAACKQMHEIGELHAIQTHWYVRPHGCMGGDYWKEGELQFVCPDTSLVNRLLFETHDVPYKLLSHFDHNPQEQFKRNYKKLFKKVEEEHSREAYGGRPGAYVNNYYVDAHRKKFGLVEKRKR